MKGFKFISILAVAALLIAPATAMARSSFNFSFNVLDCFPPCPPPPVIVEAPPPVYVPYHPPCYRPQPRPVVKEYHHYYYPNSGHYEEIRPYSYHNNPGCPSCGRY